VTKPNDGGAQAPALRDVEKQWRSLVLGRDEALMPGIDPVRQRVYRRLVRNSLTGNIRRAIPHAIRIAGEAKIEELLVRFLDEVGPQTRIYRQVPSEFADWAMAQELGALGELMHWEILEVDVILAPDTEQIFSRTLTDGAVVITAPSARLAAYMHPVHQVNASTTTLPAASSEPVLLLAWRAGERYAWQRIDGAVAKTLVAAAEGKTSAEAFAAIEATTAPGDRLDRERTKATLVDLQRRGAIAGFHSS
jgi:hypothetical protein